MTPELEYEVSPGSNWPPGLSRLRLPVLSPVWQGEALRLEFPDGEVHTLVGWSGSGEGAPCALRVFWTRHEPQGPPVVLAIGGDAGVRHFAPGPDGDRARGLPFLALALSTVPPAVRRSIGPQPQPEKPTLLLG